MRRGLCLILLLLSQVGMAHAEVERIETFGKTKAGHHLLVRGALDLARFGPVIQAFVDQRPDFAVTVEQWNTLELHQKAEADCRAGQSDAALLISSAADLMVKLANMGCAQAYVSPETEALPPERNWRNELFGITQEPAVMIYNRNLLAPEDQPRSRFELLDLLRRSDSPLLGGKVATYDIRRSGIGYLFASVDARQATTFGSLLEAFGRVDAVTTCCSAEISAAVISGRFLLAYNILGSYALEMAETHPELAVIGPTDYTIVLSRPIMIPRHSETASGISGALIDFLLSESGRAALAKQHHYVSLDGDNPVSVQQRDSSSIRQIPLSPVLLLGLDGQQKEKFLKTWDEAFSPIVIDGWP